MEIVPGQEYLDGQILIFDKPYRWTSFDLVKKVRCTLEQQYGLKKIKVGHAGTLDPLATGLMIIATGKFTKRIDELQAGEKEYFATIRMGATTPGFDLEKEIDAVYPFDHITPEMITDALQKMTGTIDQIPPVYSAKKIEGERAYEKARRGEFQELEPKQVVIKEIEFLGYTPPDVKIRIVCSKGTYIRSVARDLGILLQSGAHLIELRRTRSGDFTLDNALTLEMFQKKLL